MGAHVWCTLSTLNLYQCIQCNLHLVVCKSVSLYPQACLIVEIPYLQCLYTRCMGLCMGGFRPQQEFEVKLGGGGGGGGGVGGHNIRLVGPLLGDYGIKIYTIYDG